MRLNRLDEPLPVDGFVSATDTFSKPRKWFGFDRDKAIQAFREWNQGQEQETEAPSVPWLLERSIPDRWGGLED